MVLQAYPGSFILSARGTATYPDDPVRVGPHQLAVAHPNLDRFPAVQARCVDLDHFAGEKPADRQRLECSPAEPFLLSVDSDPSLGR